MSLNAHESDDGLLIPVRVVPRASRTEITGVVDGALRVRLAAAPVEGAANRELCAFLAKLLGTSRGDVELISGERGKQKIVRVRGIDRDTALARLAGVIGA